MTAGLTSRPRRRRRQRPDFGRAALDVRRLAVMLDAGLAPESAWRQLAAGLDDAADAGRDRDEIDGPRSDRPAAAAGRSGVGGVPGETEEGIAGAVVDGLAEGHPLSSAITDAVASASAGTARSWAPVAAAWSVAAASGAPLAPTLDRLAVVLSGLDESAREVEIALAGPAASARIVVVLPVVGILFGLAIGTDTIGTLFGTAPGLICLAVGVLLLVLGALWSRRLVGRARSTDPTPGLAAELVAVAVSSGLGAEHARELVDAALDEAGLLSADRTVTAALAFSRRAGVPAARLLRAEAEQARRQAATEARRRAAALGVRLMLPLGVCVLPSFLALGVMPVVLSLVSSTARVL
ncbi:type II secretion system F family protein [Schumannella soli]|uniref:Pilus assembly protein n=1 Tax=Schumannella soli TaxID=2590779 RepID=A0A506Y8C9_9MICO|nr:type II secretion system F family protein [Schumannella soli]TPW77318.1 pilus assembly protein [Schumannella soli]